MDKTGFLFSLLVAEKKALEKGDTIKAGGCRYVYMLVCNGYWDWLFE